jgi:two-component system phosphate regulon response regulator PhoB
MTDKATAASKEAILIIEDDPEIQELLSFVMTKEGWKLIQARTGEEGLDYLKKNQVNCILLDIMLPGMDGFKLLKELKEIEMCRGVPVIMTITQGEEADIITGLELGADDYVIKPYSPKVLIARVRANLRRQEEGDSGIKTRVWQQGKLRLDADRHMAFYDGRPLDLYATEFALLQHFLSHPDIAFTRGQIIAAIKGEDYPVTDRSVDVQIRGLRKKLAEAGDMIETIRGIGYRLRTDGTVYTADINDDSELCYWRGTTKVNLPVPSDSGGGSVNAIAVTADGTVYTAGYYTKGGVEKPCYWRDTTIIDLPLPSNSGGGSVNAIAITADGTVYTAGENDGKPCYWQGTTKIDLPSSGSGCYC